MGIFDDAINSLNIEITKADTEADAQSVISSEKTEVRDILAKLENAHTIWKNHDLAYQKALRDVYDIDTDTFSAAIEPFLTEGMKNHIRSQFS